MKLDVVHLFSNYSKLKEKNENFEKFYFSSKKKIMISIDALHNIKNILNEKRVQDSFQWIPFAARFNAKKMCNRFNSSTSCSWVLGRILGFGFEGSHLHKFNLLLKIWPVMIRVNSHVMISDLIISEFFRFGSKCGPSSIVFLVVLKLLTKFLVASSQRTTASIHYRTIAL